MPLSSRLELPYLEPAQAQKHVTHNEALRKLDMLVQLSVQGFHENTPPALPVAGQVFALGAAPTGDWAGQADMLAVREDTGWGFASPQPGWSATLAGSAEQRIWDGAAWRIVVGQSQNLDGLGVNTSSDATNRLAVSAPATLLTHEGADHRLILNKAGAEDTASVLFQSDWMGHAELGLSGGTDFSVKVSLDGTSWTQALAINPATGSVAAPVGLTVGGSDAYHRGNLLGVVTQSGGLPTGAVIERGQNANGTYVRFADGTQICFQTYVVATPSWTSVGMGYRLASPPVLQWAASFSDIPTIIGHIKEYAHLAPGAYQNSSNYCSINVSTFNQPGGPLTFKTIAIGRWN